MVKSMITESVSCKMVLKRM